MATENCTLSGFWEVVDNASIVEKTDREERGRMHGLGTRMLLKECLDQGVSKTELLRRFGVSRRTI